MEAVASPRRALPIAPFAAVAVSLLCACNDISQLNGHGALLDPGLQLIAHICMALVAAFAAFQTSGDPKTRLLIWGLIGVSLDLSWQTIEVDSVGSQALQWVEMTVKYVAVGTGLGLLTQLTTYFGDSDEPLRRFIRRAAPFVAGVTIVVGLVHGALWITQCQLSCDPTILGEWLELRSTQGYLLLDGLLRVMMIVAACVGVATASNLARQRLLLIAIACILFAAGTALDFLARLPLDGELVPMTTRHLIDGVTTLLFPLLLGIAILRRQLFDVEYAINRAVFYSAAITLISYGLNLLDSSVHWALGTTMDSLLGSLLGTEDAEKYNWAVEIMVGLVVLIGFTRIEEPVLERARRIFAPGRERRIDALREFGEHILLIDTAHELQERLFQTIQRGTDAAFTDLFVHDKHDTYVPLASTRDPKPRPILAKEELVTLLGRGKPIKLKHENPVCPGAEIALPMHVGGKLFGFLLCGPKKTEISYAPDELRELETIARGAGASLLAFRTAL